MPYTQKISPLGNIFPEPGTRSVLNGNQDAVEPGWEVAYYDDKFLNDWLAQTQNAGVSLVTGRYEDSALSNIQVWFPHSKQTVRFPETPIPAIPQHRQVWYTDRSDGTIKVVDLPGRQLFMEDFEAWVPTADQFPLLHTGHFQSTATATTPFEKFIAPRQSGYAFIPLGTLLPVATHLQGAYDLPASGQVSVDGFMRCDGATIPPGQRLTGHVPDLTDGRFLRGVASDAGQRGGTESFTLAEENLPAHTHSMNHVHNGAVQPAGQHGHIGSTGSAGNHNHGTSGSVTGVQQRRVMGGETYLQHYVVPRYQTYNPSKNHWHNATNHYSSGYAGIRNHAGLAGYYGLSNGSLSVSSAGSHTHPTTISSGGSHTHPLTINPHRGQTGAKGAGLAKVHLPKYFDVLYLIKVN